MQMTPGALPGSQGSPAPAGVAGRGSSSSSLLLGLGYTTRKGCCKPETPPHAPENLPQRPIPSSNPSARSPPAAEVPARAVLEAARRERARNRGERRGFGVRRGDLGRFRILPSARPPFPALPRARCFLQERRSPAARVAPRGEPLAGKRAEQPQHRCNVNYAAEQLSNP